MENHVMEALEELFGINHENAQLSAVGDGKVQVELPNFDMKFLFCPTNNTLAY